MQKSVREVKNRDLRLEKCCQRPQRQHFQDLGHSFPLNGPTSRAITNIALGSEIRKQGRVTSPITISFYSGEERKKITRGYR